MADINKEDMKDVIDDLTKAIREYITKDLVAALSVTKGDKGVQDKLDRVVQSLNQVKTSIDRGNVGRPGSSSQGGQGMANDVARQLVQEMNQLRRQMNTGGRRNNSTNNTPTPVSSGSSSPASLAATPTIIGKVGSAFAVVGGVIKGLTGTISNMATAVASAEGKIGGIVGSFTSSIPLVGPAIESTIKALETNADMYRQLSSIGQTFGGDIIAMRKAATSSGLTMDQFTKTMLTGTTAIRQIGGRQFASAFSSARNNILQLGYSAEEAAAAYGEQLEYMRVTGRLNELNNASSGARIQQSLGQITQLSAAFGVARDAILKESVQIAKDPEIISVMAKLSSDQQQSLQTVLASLKDSPELQKMFRQSIERTQGVTTVENATATSMNPELTRKMDQMTSAMTARGATPQEIVDALREIGKSTADLTRNNVGMAMYSDVGRLQAQMEIARRSMESLGTARLDQPNAAEGTMTASILAAQGSSIDAQNALANVMTTTMETFQGTITTTLDKLNSFLSNDFTAGMTTVADSIKSYGETINARTDAFMQALTPSQMVGGAAVTNMLLDAASSIGAGAMAIVAGKTAVNYLRSPSAPAAPTMMNGRALNVGTPGAPAAGTAAPGAAAPRPGVFNPSGAAAAARPSIGSTMGLTSTLGKANFLLNGVLSVFNGVSEYRAADSLENEEARTTARIKAITSNVLGFAGGLVGGGLGAAAGSVVPVAGTAAGGLAGGYAGSTIGKAGGDAVGEVIGKLYNWLTRPSDALRNAPAIPAATAAPATPAPPPTPPPAPAPAPVLPVTPPPAIPGGRPDSEYLAEMIRIDTEKNKQDMIMFTKMNTLLESIHRKLEESNVISQEHLSKMVRDISEMARNTSRRSATSD